jgi:hypothetical protein
MAKYKLACGLEYDVQPAGLGPETDAILEVMSTADSASADPAALKRYMRDMFRAIIGACCPPEVAEKATLIDALQADLDAIQGDALPGMNAPAPEGEPKNADGPGDSANGSGPDSKAGD